MAPRLSTRKKAMFAGLSVVLAIALTLAAAEASLRAIDWAKAKPQPAQKEIPVVWHTGFSLRPPNITFTNRNELNQEIVIHTDAMGLRNSAAVATSATKTLLVLGDSFVEAINTEAGGTFCARLERELGAVRVVNAGLGGYSNYNSYMLLRHVFEKVRPDGVVLMAYLGNDLRDNYWSMKRVGASGKEEAAPPPSRGQKMLKSLARHSRLAAMIDKPIEARTSPLADPWYDYFQFEIETLRLAPRQPVAESIARTKQALGWMMDFCDKKKVPFEVIAIPSKAQVLREMRLVCWYERSAENLEKGLDVLRDPRGYSFDRPSKIYGELCAGREIPYLSLLEPFRNGGGRDLYCEMDVHWNGEGQKVAARIVAGEITRLLSAR